MATENERENLNDLRISTDYAVKEKQVDYSTNDGEVSVYFKDLRDKVCKLISESYFIAGCVAWLTDKTIIEALSMKECSIIVQKEDFLRPDYDGRSDWKMQLRNRYSSLRCNIGRLNTGIGRLEAMSCGGDMTIQPIRCVGHVNTDRKPAFPRMHHKFIVFCKYGSRTDPSSGGFDPIDFEEENETEYDIVGDGCDVVPYAVWTGSFNFTDNGSRSMENAVVIRNKKIANAYMHEYGQVAALSEPLDWDSEWAAPEWRIGT